MLLTRWEPLDSFCPPSNVFKGLAKQLLTSVSFSDEGWLASEEAEYERDFCSGLKHVAYLKGRKECS